MAKNQPPYLRRDRRNGIWNYRRTIPPGLRAALGGKVSFIRSLGTSTDRFTGREFKRAYARAHAEAEALLRNAEAPVIAMTQRDSFGLMREILLEMEMTPAAPEPRTPSPSIDVAEGLLNIQTEALVAELAGDKEEAKLAIKNALEFQEKFLQVVRAAQAADAEEKRITEQVLDRVLSRLGLQLTPQQKIQFLGLFEEHKTTLLTQRSAELKDLNFNSVGGVLEKLPEPPSRITRWETLRDAWITSRGGRQEIDGTGVTQSSINRAEDAWSEISRVCQVINPTDVSIEMVRKWLQAMRDRGCQEATVKSQLKLIRAIFEIGVSEGLLENNVTRTLKVSGGDSDGYQPFTYKQVHQILQATETANLDYQFWLPRLALYTGSRIEELAQLTSDDVCIINGIQCLWLKHEPTAEYPKKLKGKKRNERQVPLHSWLIEIGFIDFAKSRGNGRIFIGDGKIKRNTIGPSASRWFRLLLQKLEIWEERKLVFHSWRSTFKDMCRRCGIRAEYHDAITGHSSGTVGELSYGETLRMMPAVTAAEIQKLPTPEQLNKISN